MKTLEHQLADYGHRQRELHGPISPDELISRLGQLDQIAPVRPIGVLRPPPELRPRQPWSVAVAAAAAVLVLMGGVVWLSPTIGPDPPVVTLPQTPSLLNTWSRVPNDEAVFGGDGPHRMYGVTVGGPGLVAVGSVGFDGAMVWTSPDGITWYRVPHNDAVFGTGEMLSVTVGGPGLVAVGDDWRNGEIAAVWTSPDGVTWYRVPHNDAVFGGVGPNRMNSVTVGGPGLVAVGSAGLVPAGLDGGARQVAAVWTSPDGITWSKVPHDDEVFRGGRMRSVTVGGPGLVAVGWAGGRLPVAAVWTSPDGITWSRVPHNDAFFGTGEMRSVTVGGPGLVAVGENNQDAAVWTSPDGITWSRVPHDETVFGGESFQGMNGVIAAGPGLVAVGSDHSDAALWASVDGITWFRVPDDGVVFGGEGFPQMRSVTAGGPGLVAVGSDDGLDLDVAVWVAAKADRTQ